MRTYKDIEESIIHGAVRRIRPKMMTVSAMFMGLLPAMWSTGAGTDVMKRIAAPMVGGIFTSFGLELLIYPVLSSIWKWRYVRKHGTVIPEAHPLSFSRLLWPCGSRPRGLQNPRNGCLAL